MNFVAYDSAVKGDLVEILREDRRLQVEVVYKVGEHVAKSLCCYSLHYFADLNVCEMIAASVVD